MTTSFTLSPHQRTERKRKKNSKIWPIYFNRLVILFKLIVIVLFKLIVIVLLKRIHFIILKLISPLPVEFPEYSLLLVLKFKIFILVVVLMVTMMA